MPQSAETPPLAVAWPQRICRWCVRWRHVLGLLAVLGVFALSSIPNTHPPRVRGLDKVEHGVEYFVAGLLFLNVATRGYTRLRPRLLGGAWGLLLLVALLDESYQRWIPGRSFDWWDVLASAVGGLAAVGVVLALRRISPHPAGGPP